MDSMETTPDWPPHWLPDVLKRTFREYGSYQQQWIEKYQLDGGIVHCRPGCSHCCNMSVRITLAEAIYLDQHLTTEQRKRALDHSQRVQEFSAAGQIDDDYFYRFRISVGECPFLDCGGHCSIYPHMPMPCRQTNSSLPGLICQYDIMDTMGNENLEKIIAGLDPEINRTTPYIFPLIKRGEILENQLHRETKDQLGFSIEGEMSVLADFLSRESFRKSIQNLDRKSLISIISSIADPRLLTIEPE